MKYHSFFVGMAFFLAWSRSEKLLFTSKSGAQTLKNLILSAVNFLFGFRKVWLKFSAISGKNIASFASIPSSSLSFASESLNHEMNFVFTNFFSEVFLATVLKFLKSQCFLSETCLERNILILLHFALLIET